MCWDLTTRQPLWVMLCRLPEKGRKETKEIVEEMKERNTFADNLHGNTGQTAWNVDQCLHCLRLRYINVPASSNNLKCIMIG